MQTSWVTLRHSLNTNGQSGHIFACFGSSSRMPQNKAREYAVNNAIPPATMAALRHDVLMANLCNQRQPHNTSMMPQNALSQNNYGKQRATTGRPQHLVKTRKIETTTPHCRVTAKGTTACGRRPTDTT